MDYAFNHKHSNVIKGIAVILLMIHHGLEITHDPILLIGHDFTRHLMLIGKACVSIFVVLTGYGLYFSAKQKRLNETPAKLFPYTVNRIAQVYKSFWYIYIVALVILLIFSRGISEIYPGATVYFLSLDFLGLTEVIRTPRILNSWWYLSALILYYLLFPILFLLVPRLKKLNFVVFILLNIYAFYKLPVAQEPLFIYLICFYLGLILAHFDLINKAMLYKIKYWQKVLPVLITILVFIVARNLYLVTFLNYYIFDWVIAVALMLLVPLADKPFKSIYNILAFLGQRSLTLYLTHGLFIRYFSHLARLSTSAYWVLFAVFLQAIPFALLLDFIYNKVLKIPQSKFYKHQFSRIKSYVLLVLFYIVLLFPLVYANTMIKEVQISNPAITVNVNKYQAIEFKDKPLFWSLAQKEYRSENPNIALGNKDFVFGYQSGDTKIKVFIGKKTVAELQVVVKE